MQRIDLGYWYKIGETIHPLTELYGAHKVTSIYLKLHFAKAEIETILPQMYSSHASAVEFITVLNQFLNINDLNRELLDWETALITRAATKFETAFKAELGTQPCYHVTPKGGYNVDILTMGASALFPADLITLVPNLEYDIDQVGKCLAFEVPTAAAFHLHRINEAVLIRYWEVFTKQPRLPKKDSNMGSYLNRLKTRKKQEAKLIAVLLQIKDLHRNPCIHPEVQLTVDEAIELYGIIRSSVARMLVTIREG